ncbi:60S ribosomal protein L15 [Dionaea muscipula]
MSSPVFLHPLLFQGNVGNLREKAFTFEPAKLRFRCRVGDRRPLVVVNQAASPAASGLGIGDGPSISTARFRLDNLGPQPGSRRRAKRKGRGHAAGQGKTCGFGMKGQKSRSGPGIRKGFEGGQMPLYRRIPKLRGIAGGN